MTPHDAAALEQAYKNATVGKFDPSLGVASGKLLNYVSGTKDYLEDRVYVVSKSGVTLVED